MNKGIKITIPEPCSQKWNELTAVEKGRFCLSCEKVVIDFSTMTDKELIRYFKDYQGNICGNFNSTQTDRIIKDVVISKKSYRLSKFIASLFGLFLSFSSNAQVADTSNIKPVVEISPLPLNKPSKVVSNQSNLPSKTKYHVEALLQGRIGGICIQEIEEDKSKKALKNNFLNRIEDIVRRF